MMLLGLFPRKRESLGGFVNDSRMGEFRLKTRPRVASKPVLWDDTHAHLQIGIRESMTLSSIGDADFRRHDRFGGMESDSNKEVARA